MSAPPSRAFEVVTTREGARAVLDVEVGEVMHPHGGPRREAEQLYVAPSRLRERLQQRGDAHPGPLGLLDVGLGGGSNAIAALRVAWSMAEGARALEIVSFDRTLGALSLCLRDEHAEAFDLIGEAGVAARALLETGVHVGARTRWRVVLGELPHTLTSEPSECADVVFWDPFSPRADPSLWGVVAFTALRRLCRARATVHTYSGATSTRSALLLAGFTVGFGGPTRDDRSATCAACSIDDLERPLDLRWLERLRRSSSPFPADAPNDALDRIAAHPQFSR